MLKRSFKLRNVVKTVAILAGLFVASCNNNGNDPENPNNSVPDPAGTITANISEETGFWIDLYGQVYGQVSWTYPDNFELGSNYSNGKVSICNLGSINGLGNITQIPVSGFTAPARYNYAVACEKGHGYVVKFESSNLDPQVLYVRLYVVEKLISTGGGIMGAKVKYQYPFEP